MEQHEPNISSSFGTIRLLHSAVKIPRAMHINQLRMKRNGHPALRLCTLAPEQRKSGFCSVLRYQYLILHVVATSVLSRAQQWQAVG